MVVFGSDCMSQDADKTRIEKLQNRVDQLERRLTELEAKLTQVASGGDSNQASDSQPGEHFTVFDCSLPVATGETGGVFDFYTLRPFRGKVVEFRRNPVQEGSAFTNSLNIVLVGPKGERILVKNFRIVEDGEVNLKRMMSDACELPLSIWKLRESVTFD